MTTPFLSALSERLGCSLDLQESASGGCISDAFSARAGSDKVFVKTGPVDRGALFVAEADGLAALHAAGTHRIPRVLAQGEAEGKAFLVLEWLELAPIAVREEGVAFGRALAELHRQEGAHYGWARDNFIGATPQENGLMDSWPLFFARKRLKPQFALARQKGAPTDLLLDGERLVELVPAFFLDFRPMPSLLHGDLWHGNAALCEGRPTLFDPAVHYGDRESDIAMTELFGGFPESFYAAYREAWPLSPDYERRKPLYNLYHVLNHYNMFGAGYLNQAKRMTSRLLAEVRR